MARRYAQQASGSPPPPSHRLTPPTPWVVVIPVKPATRGKTRLRGAIAAPEHEHLARALALDTITAAQACPLVHRILVVTDDTTLLHTPLGVDFAADPADGDLNAAVRRGARLVPERPVAVLTADLPALRPTELAAALQSAAQYPQAFVPDAEGTGTVLLTAFERPDPRFGPDSAATHAASGAVLLAGDWPSLRRDVDTPADLEEAQKLGVGCHTRDVLARAALR